ncbi:RNA polymerase II subunit Rpb12 [Spironucleus salmonicida]|uniref:RNA polymerase II subunit Rpb12 n=1 Tax=Spironucleus salmonicida TaxID=348837 RepID=V6LY54_9EUKA|nr:RNA polymerase II subunit Rpb12 [Spironucleus salmonicida]|eukprot:EST49505.1 RNA polymerase II subunit Rpb12 [Spironucleus salmonicida]
MNRDTVAYICSICGRDTYLQVDTAVQCQHDSSHQVLYKKRVINPQVYKCM